MSIKFRFLVADDCRVSSDLHIAKLSARGHCCDYVSTGDKAMERIMTHDYDGIVTDNNMPGFTGVELAQMTRQLFSLGELPIFIVTSDDRESLASALLGLHDVMVLAKPITASQIDQIVSVTCAAREFVMLSREGRRAN